MVYGSFLCISSYGMHDFDQMLILICASARSLFLLNAEPSKEATDKNKNNSLAKKEPEKQQISRTKVLKVLNIF